MTAFLSVVDAEEETRSSRANWDKEFRLSYNY